HFDSTTMHNTKILVIMAKYFLSEKGVKVRCIDVRAVVEETAKDVVQYIIDAIDNAGIKRDQVKILGADNTNMTLGGMNHNGLNNVASRLEAELKHGLFRCGCLLHIENNAFQHACNAMKEEEYFNLSLALNQPFHHFHQKVGNRNSFLQYCAESFPGDPRIVPLRSFGATRWLSAFNALVNIDIQYLIL